MLFEPGDGEVGGGHADGFLRHLRTAGCATPANPLVGANGIASPLLAPFGAHGINLAAITAARCTRREAHEQADKRYIVRNAAPVAKRHPPEAGGG